MNKLPKSEIGKIDNMQYTLSNRFKDGKTVAKRIKEQGDVRGNKYDLELMVDKRGDVKLKDVSEEVEKGYTIVKSMEDVLNNVTVNTYRDINYSKVKRKYIV